MNERAVTLSLPWQSFQAAKTAVRMAAKGVLRDLKQAQRKQKPAGLIEQVEFRLKSYEATLRLLEEAEERP